MSDREWRATPCIALGIYYESGDRLWMNLYAPSQAEWAGVTITTETTFPEGESVTVSIAADSPKAFTLALRRPSWTGDGFSVRVNNEPVTALAEPGAYVELKRTWKTGDQVSVTLPKALDLQPTPDDPRRAAIMWGPLVLAGDLGPEPERPQARRAGLARRSHTPVDVPVLITGDRPVADWLKPVADSPGTFRSNGVGRDRDVEFVPFYRLHRRVYSAYWDLFTPAEYERRKTELAAEQERLRKLEAATVAYVQPGEMQPERDFNQQGEATRTTSAGSERRPGRSATGWFSFDVPVDPSQPMVLVVTYNTDTRRPRTFEILVDGQRLAQEKFEANAESRFFDVKYPIPADLVRGKEKVTVRFQAAEGSEAALYGVRMIRAGDSR